MQEASRLGKERRRPAIILKLQELDAKVAGNHDLILDIQRQLQGLMVGTKNLVSTLTLQSFLRAIASGVKRRDSGFLTIEEAYDFILTVAAKS